MRWVMASAARAVIGKIRRLGYRKSDVASTPPRAAAARKVCSSAFERRLPPQPAAVAATAVARDRSDRPPLPARLPATERLPLADRRSRTRPQHMVLFCAGPAPLGPYCDAHRALAHAR